MKYLHTFFFISISVVGIGLVITCENLGVDGDEEPKVEDEFKGLNYLDLLPQFTVTYGRILKEEGN